MLRFRRLPTIRALFILVTALMMLWPAGIWGTARAQEQTGSKIAAPVQALSSSQAMPRYADPSARENPLDISALPAIRFLTSTGFPPFNYRDRSGKLVGFNIDLARALCDVLDMVCTIQPWPWDQAQDALVQGQGDALIDGLAMTAQTGKRFDFTRTYLEFPGRFVVPKPDIAGFTPNRLADQTVAVRKGTRHADFVRRYLPTAKLVEEPTEIAALDAVRNGTAKAYFGDGMRAAFWLNEHPGCCGFAGKPYFRSDYFGQGLAIAVPAGRDAVRLALDEALSRLQKAGTIEELYLRWFPVGFY